MSGINVESVPMRQNGEVLHFEENGEARADAGSMPAGLPLNEHQKIRAVFGQWILLGERILLWKLVVSA